MLSMRIRVGQGNDSGFGRARLGRRTLLVGGNVADRAGMVLLLWLISMSIALGTLGSLRLLFTTPAQDWVWYLQNGTYGLVSGLVFLLMLTLGPFAAVQLWRLRESGRRAAALLTILVEFLYLGLYGSGTTMGLWYFALLTLFAAVLLSPPAKQLCRLGLSGGQAAARAHSLIFPPKVPTP